MLCVLKRIYYFISWLKFNLQLYLFRKILRGKHIWQVFEKAGITGFGTNLVRLYFSIYYDQQPARVGGRLMPGAREDCSFR